MNKLRAIVATLAWMREWFKLCIHQMRTWDHPSSASRQDFESWVDRMRAGPLRYEVERVEGLKSKAEELWNA